MQRQLQDFSITEFTGTKKQTKRMYLYLKQLHRDFTEPQNRIRLSSSCIQNRASARPNIADNQKRERPTAPTFRDAVEFVQLQINHWCSVWAWHHPKALDLATWQAKP
jgi:hypothetical protein